MKLSLFTDLGLRVLMCLAAEPDQLFQTGDLAKELKASRNHLNKVVTRLAKAGFVDAKRGKLGGVTLAQDPGDIRLGDVVSNMEAETAMVDCFKTHDSTCTLIKNCKLISPLLLAQNEFIKSLNRSTLKDIAL